MGKIIKFFPPKQFVLILDKRQKFALQTVILTAGILMTQLIWEDYRFFMVGILSVFSYLLTVWSLTEDINGIEWLLLFILPVAFTASVSLFYFLLPSRWITRVTVTTIFAIGTYATLLVENIYNVAVERSIQLLRAAQSIGLLITLVVVFLIVNIVFSTRLYFWANSLILIPFIFILRLQSIWSIRLETKLSKEILIYSLMISLCIGEIVFALSFWPIQVATASLLIAASYYSLVGMIQLHLAGRFFKNTIREYILAFIFTFIVAFLTTSWG
jgi:hypothetical protein